MSCCQSRNIWYLCNSGEQFGTLGVGGESLVKAKATCHAKFTLYSLSNMMLLKETNAKGYRELVLVLRDNKLSHKERKESIYL